METTTLIDTFGRLQEKLHRVAIGILKDEMDAEDAVQDSFCNLWTSTPPSTSDEARFRLFATLKNVCLNKLKRKRPVTGLESLDIASEVQYDPDVDRRREAVLNLLPPTQRKVFQMSLYEDLEYEEIAAKTGMTVEAVRMNMSRARKTLRQHYKRFES